MLQNLNQRRLPKWDGLDRWTGGAMLALGLLLAYLVTTLDTTPPPGLKAKRVEAAALAISPEYSAKLKTAAQLLAVGNLGRLKPLLEEMIAANPDQPEPLVLKADYHIRRQEPIAAMHAFRQALDLNLDYLEKKSPHYQGKKIRNTVREAEGEINKALAANPGDQAMRENREELRYMLRKLAGGCSD